MAYREFLEISSHWAAIITAIVAVLAYGRYVYERRQKRVRLEAYLKAEKDAGNDQGQRTVLHLVRHLKMNETDVLDAAFRSKRIQPVVIPNSQGRAETMMLEFRP